MENPYSSPKATGTVKKPAPGRGLWFSAGAEIIWAIYVVALLALTYVETLITPEAQGIDRIIDVAILVLALPGALVAAFLSAVASLRGAEQHDAGRIAVRLFTCWSASPMVACFAVFWINSTFRGNIDGGLLLFYMPILGFVLGVVVMPMVMHRWAKRWTKRYGTLADSD